MRYTLLEATQLILSAMDSDEVNSISDTVESNQVALILKSVYYDCAVDLNLQEHERLFELNASGDVTKPVLMTLPTTVTNLNSIKYNYKLATETLPNYQEIQYLPFDEFQKMQQGSSGDTANAFSMAFSSNGESFESIYFNDAMPSYYTVISGSTVIFDSYLVSEDSTLQKSKTMCKGMTYTTFVMDDSFVPDLAPDLFSYWLNRAKVRAFAELKQAPNQEAASETRNQKIVLQKRKNRTPDLTFFERLPKFGKTASSIQLIPKNLKNGN